jgi:phosphoglycerate dehydrogenase-like enzyme
MRVVAWSQNLTPEVAAGHGVTWVNKQDLFRESDVLTVHLKLSERTHGIVGDGEIALMKPTAFLVNTSRGPLISETALLAALQSRRIAGAALDVFDQEPLPGDHPFRFLPNVLATPHIGYVTENTYADAFPQIVENIKAWAEGKPIRLMNP